MLGPYIPSQERDGSRPLTQGPSYKRILHYLLSVLKFLYEDERRGLKGEKVKSKGRLSFLNVVMLGCS